MGKGLIPADGEIWRVRRRAIVPALHQKAITSLLIGWIQRLGFVSVVSLCVLTGFCEQYVASMISLFGEASYRLCEKLDAAASDGEDVEMESLFSRLTLDIIGKAVFNYDFDSLAYDNGIVEVFILILFTFACLHPLTHISCPFSCFLFVIWHISFHVIYRQFTASWEKQRCEVLLQYQRGKFQYGKISPHGRRRSQKLLSWSMEPLIIWLLFAR